ncbi:MAG: DUF2905 domain-containing protein [Candidatus Binataceae bacterium]
MAPLGKGLIAIGFVLIAAGAMLWGLGYVPLLGHLPGDIQIKRGNVGIYFPLATCVVASIVLTLIFAIFRRG